MSKRYWLGMMFFSLVIASGAGYFVWSTLQQKTAVDVPLTQVVTSESTSPDKIGITTDVDKSSSPVTPKEDVKKSEEAAVSEETATERKGEKRNILFSYRKASAKHVYVIGSFNNWKREALSKNEKGIWQVSLKLFPGSYEYKFVVDDRKIRDPNNRLYTPGGNSILKVKPLASN